MKIIIHRFSGRPDPMFCETITPAEKQKTIEILDFLITHAELIEESKETPKFFKQLEHKLGYRGVELKLYSHPNIESILVNKWNIMVTYKNGDKCHYMCKEFPDGFLDGYSGVLNCSTYCIEAFILRNQDFNRKLFP